MPPFRNPFVRKPPVVNSVPTGQDDPLAASTNGSGIKSPLNGLTASRTSSALSIKNRDEPNEFKLSGKDPIQIEIKISPSPPDKKGFWQRTPTSTTTSSHRSVLSENEPFSISRESFDSYRRSFDISARSPISYTDSTSARQSLDSRSPRTPRSALNASGRFERPQATNEEGFEEVGLNDDVKPKRKSLFSRFEHSTEAPTSEDTSRPNSSHRGFHLPGRKRGQSGQGAELGNIENDVPVSTSALATKESEDGIIG